ncbi:MAG: hypothetical protein DRP89_05820 [Candidatus Neomarinimicrobiota bacterium]|nr:MAG: hypothetical protein DRP89_05820 [Candidatus Neomarinimicrobiota bacterium]
MEYSAKFLHLSGFPNIFHVSPKVFFSLNLTGVISQVPCKLYCGNVFSTLEFWIFVILKMNY